jgi:hypothetical protein
MQHSWQIFRLSAPLENMAMQKQLTVLSLTPIQQTAWWWAHFGPDGIWSYVLTEKYGEWRPAKPNEKGIPCEAEVLAG